MSLAFKRHGQMDDVALGAAKCSCVRLRRDRGAGCGCWAACLVALALLFAVCVLPCSACIAARCFCVTAGQGATSNAIALGVALRRRLCLAFPHPAAHGLLSLISLLRAFLLNVIKRNQGWHRGAGEVGAEWGASTGRDLRTALFRPEGH